MTDKDHVVCDRQGEKESFSDRKLYASVYHPARECHYSEQEAEELANEVTESVIDWIEDHDDDVITTKELREQVIDELNDLNENVAFMYKSHLDIN